MRVNSIEVWSSRVHTPNNQSGSNVALIPVMCTDYEAYLIKPDFVEVSLYYNTH